MINKSTDKMIHEKVNSYYEEEIIKLLPLPKEERLGLLSGDIAEQLKMKPTSVSKYLQYLKADGKARCYRRRWRQA
jgi:transcription initiation factor IIE alpha subunit